MTSICYLVSDLCLQDVNRTSKRTKYWLHTREYKIDKFLSQKGPIKSSPYSQLLQNPKGDYYNNVMMQFKHYLPCQLCYYGSFILQLQCRFLGFFSIQSAPFVIYRQEHPLKIVIVFQINVQF